MYFVAVLLALLAGAGAEPMDDSGSGIVQQGSGSGN